MLQGCPGETGTRVGRNPGSGAQGHPEGLFTVRPSSPQTETVPPQILWKLSDSKSSQLLGRALFSPHKVDLPELVQWHS